MLLWNSQYQKPRVIYCYIADRKSARFPYRSYRDEYAKAYNVMLMFLTQKSKIQCTKLYKCPSTAQRWLAVMDDLHLELFPRHKPPRWDVLDDINIFTGLFVSDVPDRRFFTSYSAANYYTYLWENEPPL